MEAIEGILEEMRERQKAQDIYHGGCGDDRLNAIRDYYLDIIGDFADRIEAAYAELLKKIQKLESALKPVLDIVMDSATSDLSMELAITEAQRIYNEDKQEAK